MAWALEVGLALALKYELKEDMKSWKEEVWDDEDMRWICGT